MAGTAPSSASEGQAAEPAAGPTSAAAPTGAAVVAPSPAPVSAEANPLPSSNGDTAAEALGRRTLSTAFVRVGPDNLLSVGLRDGRTLVLRNVVMNPRNFCGVEASGGGKSGKYCGNYADVASARPGAGDQPTPPDLAAPNPLPAKS